MSREVVTLLTSIVSSKFNIPLLHQSMLLNIVSNCVDRVQKIDFNTTSTKVSYIVTTYIPKTWPYLFYVISMLFISFIGLCFYKIFKFLKNRKNQSKILFTITIYSESNLSICRKYIKHNTKQFSNNYNYQSGSIEVNAVNTSITPTKKGEMFGIDEFVGFHDPKINISGYFVWRKTEYVKEEEEFDKDGIPQKRQIKDNVYYLEIKISKNENNLNATEILQKIADRVESQVKKRIVLYHIDIILNWKDKTKYDDHKTIIYEGSIEKDYDKTEQIYINPFFHQEKDRLWSYIKTLHLFPNNIEKYGQFPQCNLLLYGPPGTGKSSFAYRVAMALYRHIITLDFRHLIRKKDLYQLIKTPVIDGQTRKASDCVFIFDEFDISIRYIYEKQKNKELKRNINKKKLEFSISILDKNQERINSKESLSEKDENLNDSAQNLTEKTNKFCNPENEKNLEQTKYINSRESILESLREINHDVTLKDLLNVFQGPVPIKGAIMIATTNDFDEIHDMCPALFRPGRLTPIHFGYPDKKTIVDISQYYFKQKPTCFIQEQTKTPTSAFIALAIESVTSMGEKGGFDYFQERLKELLTIDARK